LCWRYFDKPEATRSASSEHHLITGIAAGGWPATTQLCLRNGRRGSSGRGRLGETMATATLRVSAPLSPYRDCEISVCASDGPMAPARARCTDVATGLIVGAPAIEPGNRIDGSIITPAEVIRMIGGTYRLASIAIDIETEELALHARSLSRELRLRRRLWRRRKKDRSVQARCDHPDRKVLV
jgi:hypothetical protein